MKWYAVMFECPTDKAPCILRVAAFSADQEMQYTFQCPLCNEHFEWRVFPTILALKALKSDMVTDIKTKKLNRAVGQEISRIVHPPLAKKPEGFNSDDLALMKAFNIADEESDGTR